MGLTTCPAVASLTGWLSGAAGNVIATGNQHRRYCITRDGHADPATSRQALIRLAMTQASDDWKAKTEAERASWREYAKHVPVATRLNLQTYISGREHFCRVWIVRRLFGDSFPTAAPTKFTKVGFSPVSISYAVGFSPPPPLRFRVTFNPQDAWCFDAKARLCIYWSDPVPEHVNYYDRSFANRGVVAGTDTGVTSPQAVLQVVEPPSGTRLFFNVRLVTSDQRMSDRYRPKAIRSPPL